MFFRKANLIRILFLTLIVFSNEQVQSQINPNVKVYGLQEVLRTTLRNNYDLRINNANIEYSEADLKNAFGRYLPGISFSSNYQRQLNSNDNLPSLSQDFYSMRLGAQLPLFDGFGREANYSRSQRNLEAAKLSLEQMLQMVYLDAYNEYISVVRSMQIIKVRRENIELGKAELDRINALFEAGVLPITSVYAQEADLGNKEIELINSENDFNVSKARLLTIMGLSPDMDVEFNEMSIPSEINDQEIILFKQEIGTFQNAVEKALITRHDYQAAIKRYESAEFSIEMSKAAYFPTLSASTDWQWNNTAFKEFGNGNYYFGLNLSVPIFSNFAIDAQVQSMKLGLEQRNVELLKMEQNIRAGVQISYLNLQSAEKQVEISKRTVRSAEENYRSTQERVQVGAATINDLIQASTQMITAQINQISAVYNYVRAKNDIKYAIGNIAD